MSVIEKILFDGNNRGQTTINPEKELPRLIIGRSKVRVLPGPPFIPLLGAADSRTIFSS